VTQSGKRGRRAGSRSKDRPARAGSGSGAARARGGVVATVAIRPADSDHAFRWRAALLVFSVALVFRALYLWESSREPAFNLFYMDAEYHLEWARALATGAWTPPYDLLRGGPFFRAPLYPYFLAGLFSLFGVNTVLARIVQIVIGSASCALAYGVAARCFGQRVGVVAGLLCSIYWVLAYFDAELLLPVLLVFLALLGFLLAFIAVERGSPLVVSASGLAFGLFAITRPNVLAFFPFAVLWVSRLARGAAGRRAVLFAALFAVAFALPPAAVTVRNRVVGGDWVPVASQGGVNLYIGNNARSNGMEAVVPGTRQTWWGGYEDTIRIAEEDAGRPLKPSEVSSYWFRRALAYVRGSPADWTRLTLRKALAFVGDPELPNNEPYEARRHRYPVFRAVPLSFAVLLGLFAVAFPLAAAPRRFGLSQAREPRGTRRAFVSILLQFLVLYAVSIIAFFVTGRYRVPLIPFIAAGAAVTLVAVWDLLRARRLAVAALVVVVAALITGALKVDYLGVRAATRGFAQLSEAQDRLDTGDLDGGIERLERILADGSVGGPEVPKALIRAYVERGDVRDREAILRVAEEGLRRDPDDPELLWYAASAHFQAGNLEAANDRVRRYLAQKPGDIRALYVAAGVAQALGEGDWALAFLARAEAIDPDDPLVARMRALLATESP
jgi:4-amino-4-deoxy-L-arabinose transferase-like glycosyltransferase